jgi:hypothetical protein
MSQHYPLIELNGYIELTMISFDFDVKQGILKISSINIFGEIYLASWVKNKILIKDLFPR